MALQRFYNATDKLVNAFIMGTIKHMEPCACAVGTLCGGSDWTDYHMSNYGIFDKDAAIKQIQTTGYLPREIYKVEAAFEGRDTSMLNLSNGNGCNTLGKCNDPDGFKGLCNVFDYLVTLEDWKEEEKGANIFELLEQLN